jgi:hypothetical protein
MLDACVRVFSVLCTVNELTHVARMYKVYLPGAGAELQCYRRVNWLTQLWQQAATTSGSDAFQELRRLRRLTCGP